MATTKERQSRKAKQPAKKTNEPGIGASVGWMFLLEFIRQINGSVRTSSITQADELMTPIDKAIHVTTDDGETIIFDTLSSEAINEMVAQIKEPGDIQRYLEYKEIIWHYKLKSQEHETLSYRAENYYLKTKLALSKGAEVDYKDIEQYRDNLEDVLREGRGIEVGLDVIISPYLDLDGWRVFPYDLLNETLKDFNALLKSIKGAKIKPLSKKQIEPTNEMIEQARKIVDIKLLVSEPEEVYWRLDGRA